MRIDVVTPAFNAAPYIGDAIRSVLAQSVSDWRLIVVDDGSTDGTAEEIRRFPDRRISLISQVNGGVSSARNAGIAASEADAVLFLDADDWLAPAALSILSAALTGAPQAVAAVAPYARVRAGGRVAKARRFRASADLLTRLLVQNQFPNGGPLLIRRSAIGRVGLFRTDLRFGEDWEYWVRLALAGPIIAAPGSDICCFVRERPDGAYGRMAFDPSRFAACLDAVYANPDVVRKVGAERLAALRRRAHSENLWVTGRELIRHGQAGEGRKWLRRSVIAQPTGRRLALLTAAWCLRMVPDRARGPLGCYSRTSRGSVPGSVGF